MHSPQDIDNAREYIRDFKIYDAGFKTKELFVVDKVNG